MHTARQEKWVAFLMHEPDWHFTRSTGKPTALSRPSTRTLREERWFVYEGWNVIAEFDKNPSTSAEATLLHAYAWGSDLSRTFAGAGGVGGLLGQTDSTGQLHAVCTEIMGYVMGLVHVSTATATLTDRYDYDAFGKQITHVHTGATTTTATESSFGFSTKYTDAETGLCYYGYRYYSPVMGRWLSKDPIGERGGNNLYGMVGNDAVGRVDMIGLYDFDPNTNTITVGKCELTIAFGHGSKSDPLKWKFPTEPDTITSAGAAVMCYSLQNCPNPPNIIPSSPQVDGTGSFSNPNKDAAFQSITDYYDALLHGDGDPEKKKKFDKAVAQFIADWKANE